MYKSKKHKRLLRHILRKMSVLVSAADFKSAERIAGYLLGSSILSSSRRFHSNFSFMSMISGL